jgi:hypothetical protein
MNISSVSFVLNQFESSRFRYFGIYDEDGMLVTYQNELIDKSLALSKLRNFIRENTGVYTIMAFKKKLTDINNLISRDKSIEAKYNIKIENQASQPGSQNVVGVGTTGQYQGGAGEIQSFLPVDDPRRNAPNLWDMQRENANFRTEMLLMQKDHIHYRELKERDDMIVRLQEEINKSKNNGGILGALAKETEDPVVRGALVNTVVQTLGQFLGAKQQPINGINGINGVSGAYAGAQVDTISVDEGSGIVAPSDLETELGAELAKTNHQQSEAMQSQPIQHQRPIVESDPKKIAIQNAVRELMKSDADFHINIAKLAQLAKTNPGMYKMAVQYLNSL